MIWVKIETEITDEQAGFRHKAREHKQPLYMCFVDFKNALDSISRDKLWVTMMYVADIFTDQIHVFLTAFNQNLIALLFIY